MVRRRIAFALVVTLVTACSGEEAELTTTTTTTVPASTTTVASTTTSSEGVEDGSGVTEPAIQDYEIVVRSSTSNGESLWVLIDPGDYNVVDLENLIRQLVDESTVTLESVMVYDDLEALEAGRVDEGVRTTEEQALVDEHHLVSLVDGAVIRFAGPYAQFGEMAVGS